MIALLEDHIVNALRLERPPRMFTRSIRFSFKSYIQAKHKILPDPRVVFSLSEVALNHRKSKINAIN